MDIFTDFSMKTIQSSQYAITTTTFNTSYNKITKHRNRI